MPQTQHDMKCIGMGLQPGAELVYRVYYSYPFTIGLWSHTVRATSEEEARQAMSRQMRHAVIEDVCIL
jgi:hypothetical protein